MPLRTGFGVLLAALLCVRMLNAQPRVEYSADAEKLFARALGLYTEGNYHLAGEAFGRIITEYPSSQRITAAYVMRAKALYRSDENYEAARTAKAFLSLYPRSSYVPDAEMVLGLIYCRIERYGEAVGAFLEAWRTLPDSGDARLRHEVMSSLDTTVGRHITRDSTYRLLQNGIRPAERAFFWSKIADKEIARENFLAASIALDSLLIRYPGLIPKDRLDLLRLRVAGKMSIKFGALVPLMKQSPPSAMKEIGNEVYEGMLLAFDEFSQEPNTKVRVALETRDTNRDTALISQELQELASDSDLIGILGPVFSSPTLVAARGANAHHIPLVSPTANTNGIAATGAYVFQANPDYENRGRAMARYAVMVRKCTTLAVLAPSDSYGKYLAEGFLKGAEELGARVIATEWYQKGNPVLRTQMENIRRSGFMAAQDPLISFSGRLKTTDLKRIVDAGVPLARLDSLLSLGCVVSATWLFGPNGRAIVDSLGLMPSEDPKLLDSLDIPVTSIGAIYVPISGAEEIGMVSTQLVYYNLRAQVLGSGEWNNLSELDANKRYCNGIEFESDSYVDTGSVSYAAFLSDFVARFKKNPSKNSLFGYDTARLMLSLAAAGATTRESLALALAAVHDFQGLHSRISLAWNRVNSWLHVLRYTSDSIQHVSEVNAVE
jgi:ABC-type branched-subunit amino acid transport system substrate-binding protein